MIDRLRAGLLICLNEAQDAIDNAKSMDEKTTYCYGNLIHITRQAESTLRDTALKRKGGSDG
jgi:hypothetical protein